MSNDPSEIEKRDSIQAQENPNAAVAPPKGGVPAVRGTEPMRFGDRKSRHWYDIFLPNKLIPSNGMRLIVAGEVALAILFWIYSPLKFLPGPGEVFRAFGELWAKQGLGDELITSFKLNLIALAISAVISTGLAYLTVLPVFRPIVTAVSKGRFLSLAGFTLIFQSVFGGGRNLQISMLVAGVTVFYVTSMASVIGSIPKGELDHARTLRMGEWRVVWEVVILGTADRALEVMRQNAAIGWMMLTLVEGVVRSEGGIGTMLLNNVKYFKLPEVYAIQIAILVVGLLQDGGIALLRRLVCPYADLMLERKS
ncbi:ABC transporter permease [Fimbriimonas ginsengisoli]|uniref:ABC nitrate/sulfonate/bicarbonate transporter, inner membrane subunit n=1 Tax=Fimbriimonas ginsengisoli Gsoil 348 TaxID=661478 RepID=A0A068NL39_FIMGI|nr:hypothetical protein [Fimbriimonas ginsengisoli]AIE84298.1 ABC nitrate/sulfonate/bicarbonate transporter, inner membrane subunit [Fimbriimonas ginsengisoli Gsoil 348]